MNSPDDAVFAERLSVFLQSLSGCADADLQELAAEARERGIPVIRPETAQFLRVIVKMKRPQRILEVGTAVGLSALVMSRCMDPEGEIVTIERDEERILEARENFRRFPHGPEITQMCGDAADILPGLDGGFDMIFMDAAKGQYIHFLPHVVRLLKEGGVLLSDNALQEGTLLNSHYAVPRRSRTIHRRMREYLYALTHTEGLVTSIVPVGDGAALSIREKRPSTEGEKH